MNDAISKMTSVRQVRIKLAEADDAELVIKKLSLREYDELQSDATGDDGMINEARSSAGVISAGLVEPKFTMDEAMDMPLEVVVGLAHQIMVHSGLADGEVAVLDRAKRGFPDDGNSGSDAGVGGEGAEDSDSEGVSQASA